MFQQVPIGLGTPLGNICTRSPNTDFSLSLSSSSSIVSIDDRINSQSSEASKVGSRRTLVYEENTSPVKEIQKQLRSINPSSKTVKEVYINFVHYLCMLSR